MAGVCCALTARGQKAMDKKMVNPMAIERKGPDCIAAAPNLSQMV
jgi:hypothetical protein